MSVEWIKMRKSLLASPQVVRISSALKADRFRTIGALFAAWCLFDDQTIDGLLEGYTSDVFDEVVGVRGLCDAMVRVGWIKIHANSLEAARFLEHNGQTAKRRARETVRKMSARDADKKRTESGVEKKRVLGAAPNSHEEPPTSRETEHKPNGEAESLAIPALKAKKEKFEVPLQSEVCEYCELIRATFDPEVFWDFYQTQGWRLSNGQPMRDWKSACRKWNRSDKRPEKGKTADGYHLTEAQKRLQNSDKAGSDWLESMTDSNPLLRLTNG